jgi:hypothetical protein
MSTHPIDIIANVIRAVDGGHAMGAARLAEHITAAIASDQRFVDDAVVALKADGWEETHEGPLGIGTLSDQDLANIARVVLRSVGGA